MIQWFSPFMGVIAYVLLGYDFWTWIFIGFKHSLSMDVLITLDQCSYVVAISDFSTFSQLVISNWGWTHPGCNILIVYVNEVLFNHDLIYIVCIISCIPRDTIMLLRQIEWFVWKWCPSFIGPAISIASYPKLSLISLPHCATLACRECLKLLFIVDIWSGEPH